MLNEPSELSKALQATNGQVEISKSLYWYFLEVLPPRNMGHNYFIFQEGDGERLYFSECSGKFYCYLISDLLVTDDFTVQVFITRKCMNDSFKVYTISIDDDSEDIIDDFDNFIGKSFSSVSSLAESMNVSFRV